jgi:1-acyl-sn-glycerol-3-phosphate acyltransferase
LSDSEEKFEPPPKALMYGLRLLGRALGSTYWRLRYSGLENIPKEGGRGLLIASNHQTYLDPYWICLPVYRTFRFMAWDAVFEWMLIGRMIRRLGAFPVRLEGVGSVSTMKESLRVLKEGWTLVVFPEGAREFSDGKMLEFKNGAARIALEAEVQVLPVTIRGGNKIWPREGRFPRPGKVEIFYHPLIDAKSFLAGSDHRKRADELTSTLEKIIASKL